MSEQGPRREPGGTAERWNVDRSHGDGRRRPDDGHRAESRRRVERELAEAGARGRERGIGRSRAGRRATTAGGDDRTPVRVRHLLPALLGVTVAYPITLVHDAAATIYALLYVALLALGARVASVTERRRRAAIIIAVIIVVLGIARLVFTGVLAIDLAFWTSLLAFHVMVFAVIFEYLLEQDVVDREVIFAGTSLYVLVGDMFVAPAMIVHLLSERLWHTAAYAMPQPIRWQDLVYFSFTTLTSLGYGDVLPRNAAARSLAIAESVLGVLVLALIIGRLVGTAAGKARSGQRGR
jgi:hypothetical protein